MCLLSIQNMIIVSKFAIDMDFSIYDIVYLETNILFAFDIIIVFNII